MQKHHLISDVLFRCIRQGDRSDMLEFENMRENVDISQLDYNILLTENCEGYSWCFDPDEEGDVKTVMSRNPNVLFLQTILDWSRKDRNVWSQQIAWSSITHIMNAHRLREEKRTQGHTDEQAAWESRLAGRMPGWNAADWQKAGVMAALWYQLLGITPDWLFIQMQMPVFIHFMRRLITSLFAFLAIYLQ